MLIGLHKWELSAFQQPFSQIRLTVIQLLPLHTLKGKDWVTSTTTCHLDALFNDLPSVRVPSKRQ